VRPVLVATPHESRPEELQSAIVITLRRFAEYQNVRGAFERRNAETMRERERMQAIAEATRLQTDAILLDLAMPNLTGLEALRDSGAPHPTPESSSSPVSPARTSPSRSWR
jgi:CheY-like chemotaxis protein